MKENGYLNWWGHLLLHPSVWRRSGGVWFRTYDMKIEGRVRKIEFIDELTQNKISMYWRKINKAILENNEVILKCEIINNLE